MAGYQQQYAAAGSSGIHHELKKHPIATYRIQMDRMIAINDKQCIVRVLMNGKAVRVTGTLKNSFASTAAVLESNFHVNTCNYTKRWTIKEFTDFMNKIFNGFSIANEE